MRWLIFILSIYMFIVGIVSSTSYLPLDNAQIVVSVIDWKGNKLNANCNVTIFYPNKTVFSNYNMLQSPTGNYYVEFTAPNKTGIYEFNVSCYVNNKLIKRYGTFQVSSISEHLQKLANITISAQYNISQNITGNLTQAFNNAFNQFYTKLRNDLLIINLPKEEEGIPILGMFLAKPDNSVCINNNTLRTYINRTYYIGNETIEIRQFRDKICEYGCKNNSCIYGINTETIFAVMIIIIIILVLVYYVLT